MRFRRRGSGEGLGRRSARWAGLALWTAALSLGVTGADPPGQRLSHPPIPLLDERGKNVLESSGAVSTRRSCGRCHDYPYIAGSIHFLQGRDQMLPVLLAEHGLPTFSASPGMFGKYTIVTNRQMARQGAGRAEDFDMSTAQWVKECGACHPGGGAAEVDFFHRRYDEVEPSEIGPLDPDYHVRDAASGEIVPWDWRKSGVAEADCFLCHLPSPDRRARNLCLSRGDFRWASTATLLKTGLVEERAPGRFTYVLGAFAPDGTAPPSLLDLCQPKLESCGQCHGFTARCESRIWPLEPGEVMRCAEKAGWVFNGSLISETTSPQIKDRQSLAFPWDIHAARGLSCIDCHFSPNNPGRKEQADEAGNLKFRPGPADPAVYLVRPDHDLTRGNLPPLTVGLPKASTMRECGDCHDTSATHKFLPYKERHFRKLACRVCHIPKIHFWAFRSVDWAFLMEGGGSRITYRGIEGSVLDPAATVEGFRPAYIVTADPGSSPQIRPANLISGLLWYDKQKRRPAFNWQMERALFREGPPGAPLAYRPEVMTAFDRDGDGRISHSEAVYDNSMKGDRVAGLLRRHAGIPAAELRMFLIPWAMSHSIAPGDRALRDCRACHGKDSILFGRVSVADVLPAEAQVLYLGQSVALARSTRDEALFDNSRLLEPFYLLGRTRVRWVEQIGWAAILGAGLLSLIHGLSRLVRRSRS